MIGDWKGSVFDVGGHRLDYHLFLDHDDHYERIVRRDSDQEQRDAGHWDYDEDQKVLFLKRELPDEFGRLSEGWRVLAVTTCEKSNVILVLRENILASRNLPILFYRVHGNGRAYGTPTS